MTDTLGLNSGETAALLADVEMSQRYLSGRPRADWCAWLRDEVASKRDRSARTITEETPWGWAVWRVDPAAFRPLRQGASIYHLRKMVRLVEAVFPRPQSITATASADLTRSWKRESSRPDVLHMSVALLRLALLAQSSPIVSVDPECVSQPQTLIWQLLGSSDPDSELARADLLGARLHASVSELVGAWADVQLDPAGLEPDQLLAEHEQSIAAFVGAEVDDRTWERAAWLRRRLDAARHARRSSAV